MTNLLIVLLCIGISLNKKVNFQVKGTWQATSLSSEASEYYAKIHRPDLFWSLLDEDLSFSSQEDEFEYLYGKVDSVDTKFFEFSMAVNYFSPLVASFQTLGENSLRSVNMQKDTETFVDCGGVVFTGVDDLSDGIVEEKNRMKVIKKEEDIFPFDHFFREYDESLVTCFLYGEISSKQSGEFHKVLKKMDNVNYAFRHYFVQKVKRKDHCTNKEYEDLINLQGYGIELQIKNLEYRTMDKKVRPKAQAPPTFKGIHFDYLINKHPEEDYRLNMLRNDLMKEEQEQGSSALKSWELQDIGTRLVELIVEGGADEGLSIFENYTQNFPSLMKEINKRSFKKETKDEISFNRKVFGEESRSKVFFDSEYIDYEDKSIFGFFDKVFEKVNKFREIENLKLDESQTKEIMDMIQNYEEEEVRYDFFESDRISWINDVKNEKKYNSFPFHIRSLNNPPYYGRRHYPKLNLFNFILVVDPTTKEGLDSIEQVFQFYSNNAPFRFGFVFKRDNQQNIKSVEIDEFGNPQESDSPDIFEVMSSVFKYIGKKKGVAKAVQFLVYFKSTVDKGEIQMSDIMRIFKEHYGKNNWETAITENIDEIRENENLLKKRNIDVLENFFMLNGKMYSLKESEFRELINYALVNEYDILKDLYNNGVIKQETEDFLRVILDHFSSVESYSEIDCKTKKLSWDTFDKVKYLSNTDEGVAKHSILLSLGKDMNVNDMKQFLQQMKEIEDSRLGLIDCRKDSSDNEIASRFYSEDVTNVDEYLESFGKKAENKYNENHKSICLQNSFEEESVMIIDGYEFSFQEWKKRPISLVEIMKKEKRIKEKLHQLLRLEFSSSLLAKAISIVIGAVSNKGNDEYFSRAEEFDFSELQGKYTCLDITEGRKGPMIEAVVDPLTRDGQKISSILKVMSEFFELPTRIFFVPKSSFQETPIKSWYKYVLNPKVQFVGGKVNVEEKSALFENIPDNYILTTYTDEPESWLLESTFAEHDLDNLNLDHVKEDEVMFARYQLEHLMIHGNAYDLTTKNAPQGLQFEMTDVKGDVVEDTLVMANYGYFQLKANPATFGVSLSSIGRTREIYEIRSIKISGKDVDVSGESARIFITHFDGQNVVVKVGRKKGMERENLYDEEGFVAKKKDKKGLFGNLFGKKSDEEEEKETLNIFSVASGHLYERLLKIMIRSARRTTPNNNLKFWIIKNYLSPQFKEFLPYMSKKYDFQYEFVTYKWPSWLNKQTNKIRIIWAYKVLFLDVLFPLDVKKIIYVDSDQVTRGDLSELWNIDMEGKAIALTPFCDDKKEMDGYAFWKRGYWKNHLQGKKYHISALYIVDVDKLRSSYAGDRYRVIYDNLSKDPASLSNLDQDLPNFAQHMIPIKSLPMEWLWCETWCSQSSKKKAKTIDLCNNPQTKEHKVDQAKRIVNVNNDWDFNWTDLDDEITEFTKEIEKKYGIVTK